MRSLNMSKRTSRLEPDTATLVNISKTVAVTSTTSIVIKAISGKKLVVTFPVKLEEFVTHLEQHFNFNRESVKLYTSLKQIIHLPKCCQDTNRANRTCYSYKELESMLVSHSYDDQSEQKKYRHRTYSNQERENHIVWYVFGKPCVAKDSEQQHMLTEKSCCQVDSNNNSNNYSYSSADNRAEDKHAEHSLCVSEYKSEQEKMMMENRRREKDEYNMNNVKEKRTKIAKMKESKFDHYHHHCDSKTDILPYPHNPTGLSQLCAIIKKFEERVVDQGYFHTYIQHTRDKAHVNSDNGSNNYNCNSTDNDYINSIMSSYKKRTPVTVHSRMLLASINTLYCEMCEHPTMQYMMAAIRNGDSVGDVNETQLYNLMSAVNESNLELFNWAEHNAELFVRMLNYDVIIAARQLFDERLNAKINNVYNHINLHVQRASLSHIANTSSLLSTYSAHNGNNNNNNNHSIKDNNSKQENNYNNNIDSNVNKLVNRQVDATSSINTHINFNKNQQDTLNVEKNINASKERGSASCYHEGKKSIKNININNNKKIDDEQRTKDTIVAVDNSNDKNRNDINIKDECQNVENNKLQHLEKNGVLDNSDHCVNNFPIENDQNTVNNNNSRINNNNTCNDNIIVASEPYNSYINNNNMPECKLNSEQVISSLNSISDDNKRSNMLSNQHEQPLTDGEKHEEEFRKLPCEMCELYAEGVQLYQENLEEFKALWQNWVKVQTLIGSFLINNTHTGIKTNIADEERKNNNEYDISALDNMLADFDNTLEHWWNTTYQTFCSSLTTKPAKKSQPITTAKRSKICSVSANVCVAQPSDNVKFASADRTAVCVDTKTEKANKELRWLTMLVNLFCTLAEEFYFALYLNNNCAMTFGVMSDERNEEQKLVSNSCYVHVIDRTKSSEKTMFAQKACSYALHRSFVNECAEEIANANRDTGKSTWTATPTYHLWRHLLSEHHDKENSQCAMEANERIAMNSQLEEMQCQFIQSADRERHDNASCINAGSNFHEKNSSNHSNGNTILGRQEVPSNMPGMKNKEILLSSSSSSSSSSEKIHAKMEYSQHKFPKERACIGSAVFNQLWSYCMTSKSSLLWYSECDDARELEHSLTKDEKNRYTESVYRQFNSSCPLHIHHDRWSNSSNKQSSMLVYLLNGNDNTVELHDLKLSEEIKSTRTCSMLLECAKRLLTELCEQRELLARAHSITSDNKSTRVCKKTEYTNTRIDKSEDVNVVSNNLNELSEEWNELMIKCYSLFVQPIEHNLPRPNATSSPLYIVHTKEPLMFHISQIMSRERSPITNKKSEESILYYFAGFIDSIHRTICLDKWCPTHLRVPWEILLMMNLQKCYTCEKHKIEAKVAALQGCSLDIGHINSDKFGSSTKQAELTQEKEQNFYYVQYTQEKQQEEQQEDMQQNTQREEEKWKNTHQVTSDNSVKEENRPAWFQTKVFSNVFKWNVVTLNSISDTTNRTCAHDKEHGTSTQTSITNVEGNGKSVRYCNNSNATKNVNQMHWPTISETRKSIRNFSSQEFEKWSLQHDEEEEEEEKVYNLTSKCPAQVGFVFHSEFKQGKTCADSEDEVIGTSKPGSCNYVNYDMKKLDENYMQCERSSESSSKQTSELLSARHPIIQRGVLRPPSACTTMNKPNKQAQYYLVQIHVINNECNVRNLPISLSQYGCCSLGTFEKEINISSASRLIRHWNLSPDSGVFFYSTLYSELAKVIHQKRQECSVHYFPSLATIVRFAVIANIRKFNAPWLAVEHVLTGYGDAFCMPQLELEKTTDEKSTLLRNKKMTGTLASTRSMTTTALQPNPPSECALLEHTFMPRNKKTLPRIAQRESVLPSSKSFVTTSFSSPRQDANVNGSGNEKGKEIKERRSISINDQTARPQWEYYKNKDNSINNINSYNDIKVSNKNDNKKNKVDDLSSNKAYSNLETGNSTRKFNKIEVNAKYVEEHAVNDLYEAMFNHLLLTRPTGQLNVINSLISFVGAKMKAPVQLPTEQDKEKDAQLSGLQRQSIEDNVTGNIPQLGTVGRNEETTLSTPPPSIKTATPIITASNENKLKVKRFNIHHFKKQ